MSGQIQHVMVLMLENRSFDHLFAYSGITGLAGVNTSLTNPGEPGTPAVPMSDTTPDRLWSDPGHEFEDVDWQIFNALPSAASRPVTMSGFANRAWPESMQCASQKLVPVLTHLAREFLICDHWFSSMPGPTWPNRFFVHAGSAGGLANSPSSLTVLKSMAWSEWGFSFQNGTLYDRLTAAERSWRVYHGDHFPQVCAIDTMPAVFVADPDKFRPQKQLAADLERGDVANYTFIEPDYGILSSYWLGNSQHPSGKLSTGEQLIEDVAKALIDSPAWESAMLAILYDEHGGFYDQLAPPSCTPPGDDARNAAKAKNPPVPPFSFDRCGVRVPAVIVSPWVTPGSISHEIYDHASLIRTVCELFALPLNLGDRVSAAKSLAPLLSGPLRTGAPAALPAANVPPESPQVTAPPPRYTHSLDGFARIAAQVHHALRKYQLGMRPEELHAAISPQDDLSTLPGLPRTADPNESRAYIRQVAAEVAAHRVRQGAGLTP